MLKPRLRYDRYRVPILSKDGIDTLGEAIVRDFNPDAMTEPMPLDVDRFICDYLGMVQDFAYLSNDGRYLGMTVFNDTNRVIVFDPERNEADYIAAKAGTVIIDNTLLADGKEHRYRFTMGHEGGHGILHKVYFAFDPDQMYFEDVEMDPVIQCRADGPSVLRQKNVRLWTPRDRMEWQANRFSSALLMPPSPSLVIRTICSRVDSGLVSSSGMASPEPINSDDKYESRIPLRTGCRFLERRTRNSRFLVSRPASLSMRSRIRSSGP